ncbi:MAG TPA: RES family NAD+ phosphorylase [Segetibacter sp.]|jgi:RES domain-containing protein
MIVYRFTHTRYKDDISGTGAKLFGGRWNEPGVAALYSSSSISLSLLEVLVNANTLEELKALALMKLEIPKTVDPSIQKLSTLKKNWFGDFEYTRWIGSQFLKSGENLLLEYPSAVINEEMNFLINPLHKDFKKLKVISSDNFKFDERLFKI